MRKKKRELYFFIQKSYSIKKRYFVPVNHHHQEREAVQVVQLASWNYD